jgi:hypothetical protein
MNNARTKVREFDVDRDGKVFDALFDELRSYFTIHIRLRMNRRVRD